MICERSDLPEEMCAHCLKQDMPDPCEGLMIHRTIDAKFDGTCCLDEEHRIKKDSEISLVGLIGEDQTRALGWCCVSCTGRVRLLRGTIPNQNTNQGFFA